LQLVGQYLAKPHSGESIAEPANERLLSSFIFQRMDSMHERETQQEYESDSDDESADVNFSKAELGVRIANGRREIEQIAMEMFVAGSIGGYDYSSADSNQNLDSLIAVELQEEFYFSNADEENEPNKPQQHQNEQSQEEEDPLDVFDRELQRKLNEQ
jgi:hypothetical protein